MIVCFRANLPMILTEASTGLWNDEIYVFGGFNHSRNTDFGREEVLVYDISADAWKIEQNLKLLHGRRMHKTIQFGSEILLWVSKF